MSRQPQAPRTGLGAVGQERFDAAAAVGGWRGVAESVLPTLVFVVVMAVRPSALVTAVLASLAVSAVAMVARLAQRQGLTQVVGGALLALVSAVWAWRSGEASNFYATGLLINLVWLVGCLVSLAVRWPLVGALMGLWRSATEEPADGAPAGTATGEGDAPDPSGEQAQAPGETVSGLVDTGWRTDPARAEERRRCVLATAVLAAMFALRLVVEVPLYLAGPAAVSALGVARLVLGLPLFAVTLWFVWLLVRPGATRQAQAEVPAAS